MPIVSVIIPVYKVEPYLHRCVDSILNQTFMDHEPILVDDGSPDSCGEKCEEYAVADSRVIVIHQKNGGLSCARNTGIDFSFACSDSEWISFIDSDDWVSRHYLAYLLDACAIEKSSMALCGYQKTDGNEVIDDDIGTYSTFSAVTLWSRDRVNATVAWGKLYRKNLWRYIRYPLNKIHEDEYTTYKLLFSCSAISFIDLALYYYYQNLNGIMKSEWSPKRLDSIEAFHQQTQFFIKKKYQELAKGAARRLITNIWSHLMALEKTSEIDDKAFLPRIKKKFKRYLRRYGKLAGLDVHNAGQLYITAFPFEMKIYDYYTGLVNNLKKNGLAGTIKKAGSKLRGNICHK